MMTQVPLFRLFNLRLKASEKAAFAKVGEQNLLTSIQQEPGTLAMYTGHLDDLGIENRVLELYRDQASYEVHAKSPQFQTFKTVAGRAVVDQSVMALTLLLLLEQDPALRTVAPTQQVVVLTELMAQPTATAELQVLVKSAVRRAIAAETRLVTAYFGQVMAEPQKFVLFEVFQDDAAYQQHQQNADVKAFKQASQSLITQATTTMIKPDVLVTQGQLTFENQF
ncbi:putative quinol monooxygenase [Lactiplantibacillus nangangensis]|uniref:Quinol monooxygenase n=1 Tax=Lactiplantibacillus nangangensis TaxID=2559917 RepID=A0ABW1SKI2_9LACO|nr:antibiotic biosynthesis monooxygenase [Lactiplantibacillus nangangensis]